MRKILLVDDDKGILKTLKRILKKYKLQVATAESAEEALELLQREPHDVVLTDYEMPGQNGVWLLEQVRQLHPAVRRLLTSGAGIEPDNYLRSGLVEKFLEKPADVSSILESLKGGFSAVEEITSDPEHGLA